MSGVCPICQGTGFELKTAENGVVSSARCSCELRDRGDRLIRAARIPRRYDHCSFDHFEIQDPSHEPAVRISREWVDLWPAVGVGLLFQGRPGTGKTHLAVAIARELILRKGARVLFYEQRALLKALQVTFESGATERESEVLGRVQQAEVLILDDLGAGRTTPWARDVLHDILAHRYNEERPLIITTNLVTAEEPEGSERGRARPLDAPLTLQDRLGDALMSRLHEMCEFVALSGKDYRSGVLSHKHRF